MDPKKVKYQPLLDRLIVDVDPFVEEENGIKIPDASRQRPATGKVIAVGPGLRDTNGKVWPVTVKKGQRILMEKFAGKPIVYDGKECIIIREHEVQAIEVE